MDEVVQLIGSADPQSMYLQAALFDRFSAGLHEIGDRFRKHARGLDEMWSGSSAGAYGSHSDEMARVVDLLKEGPDYGGLLRYGADALASGQQRLRDLEMQRTQEPGTPPEQYDEQARQILWDLATIYEEVGVRFGGSAEYVMDGVPVPVHEPAPAPFASDGPYGVQFSGPGQGVVPGPEAPASDDADGWLVAGGGGLMPVDEERSVLGGPRGRAIMVRPAVEGRLDGSRAAQDAPGSTAPSILGRHGSVAGDRLPSAPIVASPTIGKPAVPAYARKPDRQKPAQPEKAKGRPVADAGGVPDIGAAHPSPSVHSGVLRPGSEAVPGTTPSSGAAEHHQPATPVVSTTSTAPSVSHSAADPRLVATQSHPVVDARPAIVQQHQVTDLQPATAQQNQVADLQPVTAQQHLPVHATSSGSGFDTAAHSAHPAHARAAGDGQPPPEGAADKAGAALSGFAAGPAGTGGAGVSSGSPVTSVPAAGADTSGMGAGPVPSPMLGANLAGGGNAGRRPDLSAPLAAEPGTWVPDDIPLPVLGRPARVVPETPPSEGENDG